MTCPRRSTKRSPASSWLRWASGSTRSRKNRRNIFRAGNPAPEPGSETSDGKADGGDSASVRFLDLYWPAARSGEKVEIRSSTRVVDFDRNFFPATITLAGGEAAKYRADGDEKARLGRMPQGVAEHGEENRSRHHPDRARPEIIAERDRRGAGQQVERVIGNHRHDSQVQDDIESVARELCEQFAEPIADQ